MSSLKRVARTQMKIRRLVTTAVAAVVITAIGITNAPIASAYPNVGKLGSEITMDDSVGQVVLSWKVSDLQPSSDTIPGLPVSGKRWEANATVKAIQGTVTPRSLTSTPSPRTRPLTGSCGRPRSAAD